MATSKRCQRKQCRRSASNGRTYGNLTLGRFKPRSLDLWVLKTSKHDLWIFYFTFYPLTKTTLPSTIFAVPPLLPAVAIFLSSEGVCVCGAYGLKTLLYGVHQLLLERVNRSVSDDWIGIRDRGGFLCYKRSGISRRSERWLSAIPGACCMLQEIRDGSLVSKDGANHSGAKALCFCMIRVVLRCQSTISCLHAVLCLLLLHSSSFCGDSGAFCCLVLGACDRACNNHAC